MLLCYAMLDCQLQKTSEFKIHSGCGAGLVNQLSDVDVHLLSSKAAVQVRVFHTHPSGVVMIRFKTDDAAGKCLDIMQGRFFGGRQVKAHMWDGITSYHVKQQKETAEQQQARLEKFSAQIEGQQADTDALT